MIGLARSAEIFENEPFLAAAVGNAAALQRGDVADERIADSAARAFEVSLKVLA